MDTPSRALPVPVLRWWQITLIGIIIFLSGIDAFFLTPAFIGILPTLFGILALAVGFIMIVFYRYSRVDFTYRFPIFLAGILSMAVAIVDLLLPGVIQTSFIIIMAFVAIINSVLLILVGCTVSEVWKMRLVAVLFGMVLLFVSIFMLAIPALSTTILVRIWGVYAWIIGILCIIAGWSMHALDNACALPKET